MSQFKNFLSQVYFKRIGHMDADAGRVSTEHSSCSYGQAVIVIGNVAFGPGDIEGGRVQCQRFANPGQWELLEASGFTPVEQI
jgi:hypothetical protein